MKEWKKKHQDNSFHSDLTVSIERHITVCKYFHIIIYFDLIIDIIIK